MRLDKAFLLGGWTTVVLALATAGMTRAQRPLTPPPVGVEPQEAPPRFVGCEKCQRPLGPEPIYVLPPAELEAMKRIEQALATKISVDFTDEPLEQSLRFIAAATDPPLNIVFDRKALDDSGIDTAR